MEKLTLTKLVATLAVASAAIFSFSAQAASVNGSFTVSVVFTPVCTVSTAATGIAFTYTAFAAQVGPTTLSTPIALTCSRGIGATATAAYGEGGESAGLIGVTNLRYTLSTPTKTTAPGTPATGTTVGTIGTAETTSFTFNATLPSQAGAAPSSAVINAVDTRTLVVSF